MTYDFECLNNINADWGGVDRPAWRKECAESLDIAVHSLLTLLAMSATHGTGNSYSAEVAKISAVTIMMITKWDQEKLDERVLNIVEQVLLFSSQMGSMQ